MKLKNTLLVLVLALAVLSMLAGCGPGSKPGISTAAGANATPTPSGNLTTVGGPFLPGEVLAGLPVYPGASPTTCLDARYGPPSFPSLPSCGEKRPGYRSASAQYQTRDSFLSILSWYSTTLTSEGYQQRGENSGGGGAGSMHSLVFHNPDQPQVTVEIHVYDFSDSPSTTVVELLVIETVPLPHPLGETLPDDIDRVDISYAPGTAVAANLTVTDAPTINNLVEIIDNLPERPDYIVLGGPGLIGQTLYSLTFHSKAQGGINITDASGQGVLFGDYPALDDLQDLLGSAVKQAVNGTPH